MLVTGSDDVGPEHNPGGADNPSRRWWLLREGEKAFILHENGAKELYWMGADPYQEHNNARQADPALVERLTNRVEAMRTPRARCAGALKNSAKRGLLKGEEKPKR